MGAVLASSRPLPGLEPNKRVAVITGAGMGIGRATCIELARTHQVVVLDRDAGAGEATASAIEENGGKASFARCDVSDEGAVKATAEAVSDRFGRIDLVINNAGIMRRHARIEEWTVAEFRQVVEINLVACFTMVRHFVPEMAHGGAVINISSLGALQPPYYSPPYAAAKAGLLAMTRALSQMLKPEGVRVNSVLPGLVDTPLVNTPGHPNMAGVDARMPAAEMGRAIAYVSQRDDWNGRHVLVTKNGSGFDMFFVEDPERAPIPVPA